MNFLTKKKISTAMLMLAGVFVSASVASSEDGSTLKVWARTNYFSEALLQDFKRKTGLTVIVDVNSDQNNSGEAVYRGTSDYDLVIAPANFLTQLIDVGSVQRIDHERTENAFNLSGDAMRFMASYNPDRNKQLRFYGLPFVFGFTGFGISEKALADGVEPIEFGSLADFFNPEILGHFADCGIAVNASPNEMIRLAMLYLGEDPQSVDPDVIAKAEAAYSGIRPLITRFSDADITSDLVEEEICLAVSWSGNILKADTFAQRRPESANRIRFVLPEEGTMVWVDTLAIPANTKKEHNAHLFIDYLLEPENAASVSRFVMFPSLNAAANLINRDRGLFDNRQVFPDWDDLGNVIGVPPHDAETLERVARAWNRVKASGQ